MKHPLHTLFFSLLGCCSLLAGTTFTALDKAPFSKNETFYKVENGEVSVQGDVIREIVINSKHATVSYKNTTQKALFPKYTLNVYNQYGLLLGTKKVSSSIIGGSPHLEPGDVGGEKIYVKWVDLKSIFQFSKISLPDDLLKAKWISISKAK